MSLQRTKAALSTAEFAPHTLTLGSSFDLTALSPATQAFFFAHFETEFDLITAQEWSPEVIESYRSLEADERMEALALAGFTNHELIHRIDFLTTPFGVAYQGKACLESIGLLLDSATLVAELERNAPHTPLRERQSASDADVVSGGLDGLGARIRWFDFQRGAAPRHLKAGWKDLPESLDLLGQRLELCTVHELFPTVAIPGTEGAYFRPLTILESRAVSLTSLLLLTCLGKDQAAADDVAIFLETFYAPRESFPDYRFLLDLFLRLRRSEDFPQLARERGAEGLEAILKTIAFLGWYALHASPETNPEAEGNSNPMLRLFVALRELYEYAGGGSKVVVVDEFLDMVDESARARDLGFSGSRETIGYAAEYAAKLRRHNQDANPHSELKAHFEAVLSIQLQQLERRLERGYGFASGMPENGSAIAGLGDRPGDEELLFGEPPPPAVLDWFRLREMLLFRRARPPGFWEEVWRALGTHPGVGGLEPDSARELAVSRAQFVDNGVWPAECFVRDPKGVDPMALFQVRTAMMPRTFATAEDSREVSFETTWRGLGNGNGERLFGLDISFPEVGERVRLLFASGLHRSLIELILRYPRIALLSDAASAAFAAGEVHPATVILTATTNPAAAAEILTAIRSEPDSSA
jgi:hypothetical protein